MSSLIEEVADLDVLKKIKLVRGMKNIQRGQVLSFTDKYTIESHMYQMSVIFMILWDNDVFLFDPESDLFHEVLQAILTHDIGEAVVGDIPYHTKRLIDYDDAIEDMTIQAIVGRQPEMSDACYRILTLLDMLEFQISLHEIIKLNGESNFLTQVARRNSVDALNKQMKEMIEEGYICDAGKLTDLVQYYSAI